MRHRELNQVGTQTNINFIGKFRIEENDDILKIPSLFVLLLRMSARERRGNRS